MKQFILYFSISFYGLFIGSQITEGVLLVPYWQSLEVDKFYNYYSDFGPSIGSFYTFLTVISVLIPLILSIYFKINKSAAFIPALISTLFSSLVIFIFYFYFKGANELFYNTSLNSVDLQNELITWSYWH